jgi:hypothetical protein
MGEAVPIMGNPSVKPGFLASVWPGLKTVRLIPIKD